MRGFRVRCRSLFRRLLEIVFLELFDGLVRIAGFRVAHRDIVTALRH